MNKAKVYLKQKFPFLIKLRQEARDLHFRLRSPQLIFSEIYHDNKWEDRETLSGPGSNLEQTREIRSLFPEFIKELNVKSLLDVPCGDFFWMKMIELDVEYIGGDIVPDLIEKNQTQYGSSHHRFIRLNLIQDPLPRSDLILCRDCLVHLSFSHIFDSLKNIKASGSKYILTTTFINRERNEDIPTSSKWRPLNLQKPPFNFPLPVSLIDEKCPIEGFEDKNLGLWEIKDIPDFR